MNLKHLSDHFSYEKQNVNFINNVMSPSHGMNQNKKRIRDTNESYRLFDSDRILLNKCINGDNRKATHFLINDENIPQVYCQKCSIILASKEINIQKLSYLQKRLAQLQLSHNFVSTGSKQETSSKKLKKNTNSSNKQKLSQSISNNTMKQTTNTKNSSNKIKVSQNNPIPTTSIYNRQSTINLLKKSISTAVEQLSTKQISLQQKLTNSQGYYSQLLYHIEQYFQQISLIIQFQKYLTYNKIINNRIQNEKGIKQDKQSIEGFMEQIMDIGRDIQQNEGIIPMVDQGQFEKIIGFYQERIGEVERVLCKGNDVEFNYQIGLPEIPKFLYQISDSIQFGNQNYGNFTHQSNNPLSSSCMQNSQIHKSSKNTAHEWNQLNNQVDGKNFYNSSFFKGCKQVVSQQWQPLNKKSDYTSAEYETKLQSEYKQESQKRKLFQQYQTQEQAQAGHLFSLNNSRNQINLPQSKNQQKQILLKQSFSIQSSINKINESQSINNNEISFEDGFNEQSSIFYKQNDNMISNPNHNHKKMRKNLVQNDCDNPDRTIPCIKSKSGIKNKQFFKSYKSQNILPYSNSNRNDSKQSVDESLGHYLMRDQCSINNGHNNVLNGYCNERNSTFMSNNQTMLLNNQYY